MGAAAGGARHARGRGVRDPEPPRGGGPGPQVRARLALSAARGSPRVRLDLRLCKRRGLILFVALVRRQVTGDDFLGLCMLVQKNQRVLNLRSGGDSLSYALRARPFRDSV